MPHRLRLVDYAELEKAMKSMSGLVKLGDWNISPAPLTEISWDEYMLSRRIRIPRFMEQRQLLDLHVYEPEMASAEILWFWDCGLMQLFPCTQDLESEVIRFEDQGRYFWIGCRHEYEELVASDVKDRKPKRHEHIKKCTKCGHIKGYDSSG